MIAYVESTLRPLDCSDDDLGLDEVADAGPGGTFIDRDHTAAHFRRELWFPRLLDRDYYQAWRDAGAPSTEERCRRRKEEILRAHVVEPLAPEVERALDEIVAAARRDLAGNQ